MLKLSPEAKVGLFVLLGIILLVYMSLKIGGIRIGRAEGYTLYVRLPSAAGLDVEASVRVAGVEVGRVKDIILEKNMAKLVLLIRPDVRIGKDFTAVLKTKGLLGEKYLDLLPGAPDAPLLEDGDEIKRVLTYADMDTLVTMLSDVSEDVKKVTETLRKVLGGREGETTLRNILKNIEEISTRLNRVVKKNDERFGRIMANLEEFSALVKEQGPGIAEGLKTAAQSLTDSVNRIASEVDSVLEENRDNLREGIENLRNASLKLEQTMTAVEALTKELGPGIKKTVNSIGSVAEKLDKGEGTLGKLINEPETHEVLKSTLEGVNRYIKRTENFRTYLSYRGEYLFDAEDTKSYFSLRVQPKADKYYLFEVIDDPRGSRTTETREVTVGNTVTTTKEVKTRDKLKFSAQIAKRIGPLTFRGGLIESTGGVGLDLYTLDDRLKFSLEAFDFDKDRNPHLKAGATYSFLRFFFLTVGYDDFASRVGLESAYVGIGFRFEDQDIQYLLSNAPAMSF